MNERLTDAINWLRKERIVLSQQEFSEKVGIGPSQISEMLTGKRVISEKTVRKIANIYPELNLGWLLTGEGEMLRPGVVSQRGDGSQNVSNSGRAASVIGSMNGGQVNHNTGENIERMFTVLVKELEGFHEASRDKSNYIDRQDDYIKKQDDYIHELVLASDVRHRDGMERIDSMLKIQGDLIRAMIDQDNRIQDRADRIIGMLEKKF